MLQQSNDATEIMIWDWFRFLVVYVRGRTVSRDFKLCISVTRGMRTYKENEEVTSEIKKIKTRNKS